MLYYLLSKSLLLLQGQLFRSAFLLTYILFRVNTILELLLVKGYCFSEQDFLFILRSFSVNILMDKSLYLVFLNLFLIFFILFLIFNLIMKSLWIDFGKVLLRFKWFYIVYLINFLELFYFLIRSQRRRNWLIHQYLLWIFGILKNLILQCYFFNNHHLYKKINIYLLFYI